MPGTNPIQYETRFCDFADAHVRPILDRLMAREPRLIACAITDINGYLPTHISERSQPQSDDPDWNAEHCRNRRNFLDDVTRRAIASDKEAMLATYGMDLGDRPLSAGQERVRAALRSAAAAGAISSSPTATRRCANPLSPLGRGGRPGPAQRLLAERNQNGLSHAIEVAHCVTIGESDHPPALAF